MPQYTRREFIGSAAVGAAAFMAGTTRLPAALHRKIPIAVQLYSVRQVFQRDVPGTLAGIKKIGFEAVEFAGYFTYANNAKGLRQVLDDNGLKVCGTHLPGALGDLSDDKLESTVEFNKILGNEKLIVATVGRVATADDWSRTADKFSAIAEKLKPMKMQLGYHNHVDEFKPLGGPDGPIPEKVFFDKASPDVFVELDVGHCGHAGADPVPYIKRYAGRVLSLHVKDWNNDTHGDIVGEGVIKWPEVLDAAENVGGTQWYIIEEESGRYPLLTGIEKDYQNLKEILAK